MTFAELVKEVARLGHFNIRGQAAGDETYDAVTDMVRSGLTRIQRLGAWPWLLTTQSDTLVAAQRAYPLPDDLFQFEVESFNVTITSADRGRSLRWGSVLQVDRRLKGAHWRLGSGQTGTPQYVVRVGNELWLAPPPSEDVVDSVSRLDYLYYRNEPTSGPLLLPDALRAAAVHASLAEGLKEKDDTDQAYYETLFATVDMPDLMSAATAIGEHAQVGTSPIAEVTRYRGWRNYPYYDTERYYYDEY